MTIALVSLTPEPTSVVEAEALIEFRVMLELPLSSAAEALGLTTSEYAAIERGVLFFKDGDQWTKARALLKSAVTT